MLATSLSVGLSALALGQAPPAPLPADQIARVADVPVTRADYKHWLRIARRSLSVGGRMTEAELRPQVVQMLISFQWIEGEAALQGIRVTTKRTNAAYRRDKRRAFPRERDFRRFLRTSGQTVADIKWRVRNDLLSERIKRRAVEGAKTPRGQQLRLERFLVEFMQRWRDVTVCHEDFDSENECGTLVGSA